MAPTFDLRRPLAAIPIYAFILITLCVIMYLTVDFIMEYQYINSYARAYEIKNWRNIASVDVKGDTGLRRAGDDGDKKVLGLNPATAKIGQQWLLAIVVLLLHLIVFCMVFRKNGKLPK